MAYRMCACAVRTISRLSQIRGLTDDHENSRVYYKASFRHAIIITSINQICNKTTDKSCSVKHLATCHWNYILCPKLTSVIWLVHPCQTRSLHIGMCTLHNKRLLLESLISTPINIMPVRFTGCAIEWRSGRWVLFEKSNGWATAGTLVGEIAKKEFWIVR